MLDSCIQICQVHCGRFGELDANVGALQTWISEMRVKIEVKWLRMCVLLWLLCVFSESFDGQMGSYHLVHKDYS
jgi:hypothetical protein